MQTLELHFNPRQIARLQKLLETGMWGATIEEVAVRVMDRQLLHLDSSSERTRQ